MSRLSKEREAQILRLAQAGIFTREALKAIGDYRAELDAVRAERDALLKAATRAAAWCRDPSDDTLSSDAIADLLYEAIAVAKRKEKP